jgi:elongation factor G
MDAAMYCETITRTVEVDFTHKKQIGDGGEFARVRLRLEPLPSGAGLQFANELPDNNLIRAEWISGIQEGIQQASKTGVVAGHPVVDLRVTLLSGTYHDSDSNWRTFSLAAQGAFWDGMRKAGAKILLR